MKTLGSCSCRRFTHPNFARGFTIVEVLISICLVTILIALLLPAVQQARTNARNIECRNKLRSIGVACHNMQANTGHFPAVGKPFVEGRYWYSAQFQLLPYIEQTALFQSFDLNEPPFSTSHQSLMISTPVSSWYCPGDTAAAYPPSTSYLGNRGVELDSDLKTKNDGFLGSMPGCRPADFSDGLSNTVAFSECTSMRGDPTLIDGFVEIPASAITMNQWINFRNECWKLLSNKPLPVATKPAGIYWADWSHGMSTYSHVFPPGSISCFDSASGRFGTSIPTATSRHGGFVNALLVDGSVRAFAFHTDVAVWRSIGLRSDGSVSAGDL